MISPITKVLSIFALALLALLANAPSPAHATRPDVSLLLPDGGLLATGTQIRVQVFLASAPNTQTHPACIDQETPFGPGGDGICDISAHYSVVTVPPGLTYAPRTSCSSELPKAVRWNGSPATLLNCTSDSSGNPVHSVLSGVVPPNPALALDGGDVLVEVDIQCDAAGTYTIGLPAATDPAGSDPGGIVLYDTMLQPIEVKASDSADVTCLDPGLDDDSDGCTNAQELGTNPMTGGLRHPLNFWDFFDTPGNYPFAGRDKAVTGNDFFALLQHFAAFGDRNIDPLSTPPPPPAYHTAFDRGPAAPGSPNWLTGPANGSIGGTDFFKVLAQFGHSCA